MTLAPPPNLLFLNVLNKIFEQKLAGKEGVMMEKKKGVSSLDFGKWGRHGLDGLSRGRGERERGLLGRETWDS